MLIASNDQLQWRCIVQSVIGGMWDCGYICPGVYLAFDVTVTHWKRDIPGTGSPLTIDCPGKIRAVRRVLVGNFVQPSWPALATEMVLCVAQAVCFTIRMMTSSNGNIFRVTGHLCGAVTRSFDVYFDLRPNKRLSKQSWGWWFETLSPPLWRHRNGRACFARLAWFWMVNNRSCSRTLKVHENCYPIYIVYCCVRIILGMWAIIQHNSQQKDITFIDRNMIYRKHHQHLWIYQTHL